MENALKITGLFKSFKSEFLRKNIEILKGISLSVEEGEIFGYLGPNGAGKTTTLKCILGLIFIIIFHSTKRKEDQHEITCEAHVFMHFLLYARNRA